MAKQGYFFTLSKILFRVLAWGKCSQFFVKQLIKLKDFLKRMNVSAECRAKFTISNKKKQEFPETGVPVFIFVKTWAASRAVA